MEREQILAKLRERIVLFAASHLSRDAAEDLAQEVLLLLHEKYAHLERVEDLLPLSLQIVRFKIMSQRRKSVRRGEYTQVSITDIQLPDLDANPAEYVERKEMLERLVQGDERPGRPLPRADAAQTAGQDVSGDSEDHGRGGHQYHLHLGPPLPQEPAGGHGRELGASQTMSPQDIKKLLGGYATGTLTAEEQQALFAAALEDQELFDALAREQSLRDLLRDPAARAELLSALDAPASRFGFWQWLRRPAVAGLATACVLAIAVIAVWQETRVSPVKPAPMIVAELRNEPPATAPVAQAPPPANRPEPGKPAKILKRLAPPATPAPQPPAALALNKDQAVANAPAMPTFMARKAEAEPAAASPSPAATLGTLQGTPSLDARSLFYGNQLVPGANAFVPRDGALAGGGGGGSAPPTPRTAKAVAGLAANVTAAALRLGVRVSILRGENEADLNTALDPGETVRLKLIPNADGFLYVADGRTGRRERSGAASQALHHSRTPLRRERAEAVVCDALAESPGRDCAIVRNSLARRSGRDFVGPGTCHLCRDGLARGVRPAGRGTGHAYLAVTPHTASTNKRATCCASNLSTRARPCAACATRASGDS